MGEYNKLLEKLKEEFKHLTDLSDKQFDKDLQPANLRINGVTTCLKSIKPFK